MIETHKPRNAAAWHRLRARDITASVAGALLGEHEYTTRFEQWALKTGRVLFDPEESPAMRRGRLLEPVAVELLREFRPGWQIERNAGPGMRYFRDPEARLGATPDVLATDPQRGPGIVQIKTVDAFAYKRKWLAEGDEPEPPLWIAVQAIIEAHMTGSAWAAVAPMLWGGQGLVMPIIDIPLIPGVVDRVKRESREFWRIVEAGEEPEPDYRRDADTIDALYSNEAGDEVDLSQHPRIDSLCFLRHSYRAQMAEAEGRLKETDAEIKALMKGASVAYLKGGKRITWKSTRRVEPDGRAMSFRVLRVPQPD